MCRFFDTLFTLKRGIQYVKCKKYIYKSRHIFRAIQHMYLCIHVYVHMCIYMHTCTYECMIWESTVFLCVDLCLEWRWSTTGCHLLTFFFLSCKYVRWTTKTLTWPTQCALVCVFEMSGFEGKLSVCVHRSSFQCTVMYWLLAMACVARFWERNAPAIHLHPMWIRPISNSHTTYIFTGRHVLFPHKPCVHLLA